MLSMFFFFKQKTAYEMRISDWSSDVCSSDLRGRNALHQRDICGKIAPPRREHPKLVRHPRNHHVVARERSAVTYRIEADRRAGTCEIGRASCRERVCQYV